MVTGLVVVSLAALFVRLGMWQLDRLEQRRELNSLIESRLESAPMDITDITNPTDAEYQRVTIGGVFDPSQEVLIRSQTYLGTAGFHVITPLVLDDGTAVLVNRGWVPLTMDSVPVRDAPPPAGRVVVAGWVHLTQQRPRFGPEDPPGERTVLNRVDIDRIQTQTDDDLSEVYVVELGERAEDLPRPATPPDFDDEGPHLSYAIQWFSFAVIGVVGFFFLLRRERDHRG